MSYFYGGVRGHRGPATRCATKNSGVHVFGKSWSSQVDVDYRHEDGQDHVRVVVRDLKSGTEKILFDGPETKLLRGLSRA